MILHFDRFLRNEQFASITPDFHRWLSCALLQLRLILSCGWPDFRGLNTSCDWLFLRPTRASAAAYDLRLSGVPTAGFKLRLSRVTAAGYKLRLTPSYGWLEFRQLDTSCGRLKFRSLDTSCGWLHSTADSSSGSWIRVATDSILWLTLVPSAGYRFRLILSCGWLDFWRLHTDCSWLCPTSDLSSGGWTRNVADLYFNISSIFKDLFCKIHLFFCFLPPDFSYHWFRLRLLLQEPWSSLKKLENAWISFKTLAATGPSCSGWFELRWLIRDLRPINYLQNFDPDAPW